jgi:transposase
MKPPLYIRHVTDEERAALEAGLRSRDAFTVRRCQILLASMEGQKPSQIAITLRCSPQTVRNVIHAFDGRGLAGVQRGSNVPIRVEPVLNAEKREQVRAILHQSPRNFGQPASLWTLKRLAAVCHEQGLSETTLSCPTMLDAIVHLGVSWQRAKHWIISPDSAYKRKKNAATG